MRRLLISSFCTFTALPTVATAYDPSTHEDLSEAALLASDLNRDGELLQKLGLDLLGNEQRFSINGFDKKTIIQHIRDGSRFEDNGIRIVNHFFDPLHDRGLFGSNHRSPDWALEDKSDIDDQISSLKDARRNFYLALTASAADERERRFGLTFEKLGQVIHHLQDMAQPQHTRDDQHLDFPFVKIPGLENPSRYERYTAFIQRERVFEDLLATGAHPRTIFSRARDFWHTKDKAPQEGQGIAEFTNANFVSAGKNFTATVQDRSILLQPHPEYPNPVWDQQTLEEVPLRTLLQDANCPGPTPSAEVAEFAAIVTFFGTKVTDRYGNTEAVNPRASTLSIFDQDLELHGKRVPYPTADGGTYETAQVFSLNRFNFCATYPFLIPKAVAYSAGLIDYFFRGRLEVEDVEFTDTGIRLRVKNAIDPEEVPAWKDEILHARTSSGASGTFVVAYEYKDASGATRYGASPPVTATGGDLAPGQISSNSYNFTISIPVDASDVKYRLVFRGKLGEEEDAIAVGPADGGSGFLVMPSYVPADGISGQRLISNIDGRWKLTPARGLEAGNVDWKGWYINGRATKVLSWSGPKARYFPNSPSLGFVRFSNRVYQDGEVFAIAPADVQGAAISKDTDGREWLVVICRQFSPGVSHVVYRRPNAKSDSAALYDLQHEPDGWQAVGSFLAPGVETSWFFNTTGTAAQTMGFKFEPVFDSTGRLVSLKYAGLDRLKIEISGGQVTFTNLGNLPATTVSVSCQLKPAPGTLCGSFDSFRREEVVRSGEYIVAVDYDVNDREVLAILSDDRRQLREERVSRTHEVEGTCTPFTRQSSRERLNTGLLSLKFGSRSVDFIKDNIVSKSDQTFERRSFFFPASESVNHDSSSEHERSELYFLDLRYDLSVTRTARHTRSLTGSGQQSSILGVLTDTQDTFAEIRWRSANKEIFSFSTDSTRMETISFGSVGFSQCGAVGLVQTEVPDSRLLITGVPGSWVIDSKGNLIVSQEYRDHAGMLRHFNFLTDRNIVDLLPNAPQDARYFPIQVVK